MKILVISTFYPENDRKDLIKDTAVVHYFTKEWAKQGHEVVVLHLYAHNFRNILHYKRSKYYKFQDMNELDKVKVYLMENQFLVRNAKKYFKFQQKKICNEINRLLKEELSEFKPDALVVHFPSHFEGIIENIDLNCKKFSTFHITDCKSLSEDEVANNRIKNTYDFFIARSNSIKRMMKNIGYNVEFIANSGIDSNLICDKKSGFNGAGKKIKILYAGSFIKRKNVDTIINALALLKNDIDFEFTIIGDGKNAGKLRKIADKNGISDKCFFVGRKKREEVFRFMKNSDLFIMVSSNETLGLTYMEAMSQGCIAIGSKYEGIDGIIQNGKNGFLVNAGDYKELAQIVEKVYEYSDEELENIRANAIKTIKSLTSENVAKEYIDYIKKGVD